MTAKNSGCGHILPPIIFCDQIGFPICLLIVKYTLYLLRTETWSLDHIQGDEMTKVDGNEGFQIDL